jgi:diguanylate cyclase (GGDEF)-like protein/PAS domain S-box-containing protein
MTTTDRRYHPRGRKPGAEPTLHTVAQLPVAVITVDRHGRVLHLNNACRRMFGFDLRMPDCDLAQLLTPNRNRRHRGGVAKFVPFGQSEALHRRVELVASGSFGEFTVGATFTKLRGPGSHKFAVLVESHPEPTQTQPHNHSRDQLAVILDGIADGVIARDRSGRTVYANQAAVEALGFPSPKEVLETPIDEIPQKLELRDELGNPFPAEALPGRRAMKGENPPETLFQMRVRETGIERWALVKASPIYDLNDQVDLVILLFEDITEYKRREHQQRFLAETAALLGASLDLEQTLKNVVDLVVPQLGDWCILDTVDDQGNINRIGVSCADPSKSGLADQLKNVRISRVTEAGSSNAIVRDQVQLYTEITEDTLKRAAQDANHLDLIRQVGAVSVMVVPLKARGRVLGALTLLAVESNRRFSEHDLALAEDIASRCAFAIDNARLYRANRESFALLDTLFSQAPVGLAFWDRNLCYMRINDQLAAINGLAADEHVGHTPAQLLPSVGRTVQRNIEHVLSTNTALLDQEVSGETPAEPGRKRHFLASYYPVRDQQGNSLGVGSAVIDVTDRHEAAEHIAYLAYHDSLTGLANRALLEEHLHLAVARAQRHGRSVALLYLDVDEFKLVNDSLGHLTGDDVLAQIARRLQRTTRATDLLARPGGDEFLILLTDIEGDAEHAAAAAARSAAEVFQTPIAVSGTELQLSVSVGISSFPQDAGDTHSLLRHADAAMYQAKGAGRNHISVYAARGHDPLERLATLARLRRALSRNEFFLHYQPIISLVDNRLIGMEALLRWQDPQRGLVTPAEFIPVAEANLIEPIGEWVIEAICRQARGWIDSGYSPHINFNVSPRQLHARTLPSVLSDKLATHGIDPAILTVEITESAVMQDIARVDPVLAELEKQGLRIAIDDFGTGYSSLSRLREMRVQTLKIDHSFMREVPNQPGATTIVNAIIHLAQALGMEAIAEGVETQAQWRFLVEAGCPSAQGYYLGKPVSVADATALLEQQCLSPRSGKQQ